MRDAVANVYDTADTTSWASTEVRRLHNMDEMLRVVTIAPLRSVLSCLPDDGRLLDIGAGSGTSVEESCGAAGVEYVALDVNAQLLRARGGRVREGRVREGRVPELLGGRLLGRCEALPVQDNAFAATFSRAVIGWNANPRRAIAEQLRVTGPGGHAIFMELDWGPAGMALDSPGFGAGMLAKEIMMKALSTLGFKPTYGRDLAGDIDSLIAARPEYSRQGGMLRLPGGDHRGVFLDAAYQISGVLAHAAAERIVVLSQQLASAAREISDCRDGSLTMALPAIAVHIVHHQAPPMRYPRPRTAGRCCHGDGDGAGRDAER